MLVQITKTQKKMLSKNTVKLILSLSKKKNRKTEKLFVVEGKKTIIEGLKSNYKCKLVVTNTTFAQAEMDFIKSEIMQGVPSSIQKDNDFKNISSTVTPQGVLALFEIPEQTSFDYSDEKIIVALENISDPGNFGTIIRTCDWFGIKKILISKDSVDIYNPKVIRSTMGSIFHVEAYEDNDFYSTLLVMKSNGFNVLTAHMNGTNIFEYKPTSKMIICFSNEANGPSKELLFKSDKLIHVPGAGEAESLNVASAAAIIISHLTRII